MKRAGNLFDSVLDMENLRLAFWKASRGKRAREDQRAYAADLDAELERLRRGLADGTYPVGVYRRFTVYEPKERVVCAAAFRERVLHHALMNVLEPWIEKWLVFDTYACRKGKGQLAAVERALGFARKCRYFLKCDVRKFFDSVPHAGIESMLRRKVKDEMMVWWLMRIVGTYATEPGRGLPIGNLTSQHLANLYLDGLDRFAAPHVGYVRYMDDFVYWSDDKPGLCHVRDAVGDYLVDELGLCLKDSPYINRTAHGMDFLGFRVRPDGLRAAREGLKRYRRKMRMCGMLFREGALSESAYQDRITALTASLLLARTHGWRCAHFRDLARSVGCEPRETGRELEQRGGQLPAGVSQQQHADEPQQQQRLPRPLLRSVAI
ncbi:MAG: RNA-directed DNA polymerase [Kiritimatiellae bacterium]|nr:RNA-directed DNA polymerase [Kiritimatiellia bacterium]